MSKELLIVGAGLTGSLTAAFLARSHPEIAVTIWEKARGVGGRMSTRRHPAEPSLHVDMGAQYISRFKPHPQQPDLEFEKRREEVYSALIADGIIVPFSGTIEGERILPSNPVLCNYVAPKGLNDIAKHFLGSSKAVAYFEHRVVQVAYDEDQAKGKVWCSTANGTRIGFDGLILTMPTPQILKLEGNLVPLSDPDTRTKLEGVCYTSRYALGLFYRDTGDAPLDLFHNSWSAKYFDNPIIRYASWDTSKRASEGRGKTLLVHTSVPFGIEHSETDKAAVQALILKTLNELIPGLPPSSDSHLVHWRYSQVSRPYPGAPGYVLLSERPLVVATGDAFTESNFEGCLQAAQETTKLVNSRF